MSIPTIEMLIQRQLNNWNRYREFLCDEEETDLPPPGPAITVSRLTGSGGRTFATRLAEKLELGLHDYSIVQQIARDQNLSDAVVEQFDERATSSVNLWVQGVLRQRNFIKSQYKTVLTKIITELAESGNCLFLGRGANLILEKETTLRIRVIASMPLRLERIRKRTGKNEADAKVLIEDSDHNREEFVRSIFHTEPGHPSNFDLVFNADRISIDGMLELTMLALLDRKFDWKPILKQQQARE